MGCGGDVGEELIDGLLVQPGVHLAVALLRSEEVLREGSGIWDGGNDLSI